MVSGYYYYYHHHQATGNHQANQAVVVRSLLVAHLAAAGAVVAVSAEFLPWLAFQAYPIHAVAAGESDLLFALMGLPMLIQVAVFVAAVAVLANSAVHQV